MKIESSMINDISKSHNLIIMHLLMSTAMSLAKILQNQTIVSENIVI